MIEKKKTAPEKATSGAEKKNVYNTNIAQTEDKIKCVIQRPQLNYSEIINIDNNLNAFQQAVNGRVQVIPLFDDFVGVIDEEGKRKAKMFNLVLHGDIIVGNIVVCKSDNEGSFVGLNVAEIAKVRRWLLEHKF